MVTPLLRLFLHQLFPLNSYINISIEYIMSAVSIFVAACVIRVLISMNTFSFLFANIYFIPGYFITPTSINVVKLDNSPYASSFPSPRPRK